MNFFTKTAGLLIGFVLLSQVGLAQAIEQRINGVISSLQVIDNWNGMPVQTGESSTLARLLTEKQIEIPIQAFGIPMSNGLESFILNTTDEVVFFHQGHSYPGSTFIIFAFPALGKAGIIGANGNVGDRLYQEILASLAIEYKWPAGQVFKQ